MDDRELAAMIDDVRLAEAAESKRQERLLRQVAEEGASLVGALRDLAERGSTVVVATRAGRIHRGRIEAVGADVVVMSGSPATLVHIPSLRWVRSSAAGVPTGDRSPAIAATLHGLLSRLDQPDVAVGLAGGEVATGTVVAVGSDLVTLRQPGGGLACIPLAAVEDVVLRAGG